MLIYGADFSGAKSPEIAVVRGMLGEDTLTIDSIYHADDRLDLARVMMESSANSLTGLDFPFRLPLLAMQKLGATHLHTLAETMTRTEFASLLNSQLGKHEGKCTGATIHCRRTDVECNAYSSIKRVNPSLVQMLYSGTKLLAFLEKAKVSTYLFNERTERQVCEVYPSHSWAMVGLPRSADVRGFVEKFNRRGGLQVVMPSVMDRAKSQDIADSVVACITTAAVQFRDNIHADWTRKPSFAKDSEWTLARDEGLIVRL